MSLVQRCLQAFGEEVRDAGAQLWEDGKVKLGEMDGEYLEARVSESKGNFQHVTLEWFRTRKDAAGIEARCTCEQFVEEQIPCRHVWSVILLADAKGWDGYVPGVGPVTVSNPYADEEELEVEAGEPAAVAAEYDIASRWSAKASGQGSRPRWREQLEVVRQVTADVVGNRLSKVLQKANCGREAWFLLDVDRSREEGTLVVEFFQREMRKSGDYGKIKPLRVGFENLPMFTDSQDRELLKVLLGNTPEEEHALNYRRFAPQTQYTRAMVEPSMLEFLLPRLCGTGRFGWAEDQAASRVHALQWDDGPPWKFHLQVRRSDESDGWQIWGQLRRGQQERDLGEPIAVYSGGVVVFPTEVARLEVGDTFGWIAGLREQGPIIVPGDRPETVHEVLWQMPAVPPVDLPEELNWERVQPAATPHLACTTISPHDKRSLGARLSFRYGNQEVAWLSMEGAVLDIEQHRIIERDRAAEQTRVEELLETGLQLPVGGLQEQHDFVLSAADLPAIVNRLAPQGWLVEAEGHAIRQGGQVRLSVSSQMDWFELNGKVDFDGAQAALPDLLKAVQQGQRMVRLDDGSQGMLPEDWLDRYAPLVRLGKINGDKVEFSGSQAAILDALLAAQPSVDVDARFEEIRSKLRSFEGIGSVSEPNEFDGRLREYQRTGLGWLHFLRDFNFGGCLADDMGLGKTVQVLALLLKEKQNDTNGHPRKPSLVVVPRSLVHNWIEEAERFTPQLNLLDYSGTRRSALLEKFPEQDLIVTTYGTLRRDAAKLKGVPLNYAILDEAQAIKNPKSQVAKASRLLQANHRLALTGTPVENHLGELWSIFEFLNPGMLGRSFSLQMMAASGADNETLQLLAKALRPFILRRTKEEVLTELPEKTEQTLYCELEKAQRKQYNELRDHYRAALANQINKVGLNRSKVQVLEALLRLRQVACHPGLVDESLAEKPSAKLETLMEQLREVLEEGHKALVFSQFTKLLGIVRSHLDRDGICYEYLDGRTRKRKERIDRFQSDPDCGLFLISLKAGGQGLNLTAADYVFILDPWWNPAVEAQAIDRAHRIGQTRRVFAYRLIASGTVEEKILDLQKDKKRLAEAIITANDSLIRNLTSEDLQMLLS